MRNNARKCRLIANLLVIVVFFSCSVITASAATARASECISSYRGVATRSNGSVVISFDITATDTMNTLGASTIVIEKKSGSSWTPVKTFYSSETAGMTKSNTAFHSSYITYTGASSSATYRAKITFYAANGSTSDSKNLTTNSC